MNIFRPLPNVKKITLDKRETGVVKLMRENQLDPAWPYISEFYQILFAIISSNAIDQETLKYYCSPKFIQELLALFESNDLIERDVLKNILHKLYLKVVGRRKMFKKYMSECLLETIHDQNSFKGTAELLDVLNPIIQGFSKPLR